MISAIGGEGFPRPANMEKLRLPQVEFIAAFVNSIVLSVAIAFILWEAVGRLTRRRRSPEKRCSGWP